MRRLPIYLVIDVSESMAGEPVRNVQAGMDSFLGALRGDPFALETVYISVIAYAGTAKVVMPLTYILSFTPPKLPIGSGTCLGSALKLLMSDIEANVKKNTPEQKGDWRPIVFFLTDGSPTDSFEPVAAAWKMKYGAKIPVIAVLMGTNADATAFKILTENIIVFKDASTASYKSFFKWVSSSVASGSKELHEAGKNSDAQRILSNIEKDMVVSELPRKNTIEHFVILMRCQNTKKPYFLRFKRKDGDEAYYSEGSFPVEESYFEMTGNGPQMTIDNLELLQGDVEPCPHCGNANLGLCKCGHWLCIHPEKKSGVICPWCGGRMSFGGKVGSVNGGRG